MSILLRVDDFPTTKPEEEEGRDTLAEFEAFHKVLLDAGVPEYVLGVIPCHVKAEQLQRLGQLVLRIALHGIDHDERFQNEFPPYLTTNEVAQSLWRARDRLELCGGCRVDTYVPPHNCLDRRTADALAILGFRTVCSGPGGPERPWEGWPGGLRLAYSAFPLEYGRSDELLQRGSVEHLRKAVKKRDVYLTLHWTWERNLADGYVSLRRYLGELEGLFGVWP